ncbi:glucosidase 2 subunit beta [Trichoplusia ni]|uniref:Glucosidase 2 subunit beta n=1 Tax=Trichoplusia ni TaxID=7111 RepID=A0A7E5VUD8_TRINI|nr:glucosidase 2 subunit beta [Trichoplusia ni]
MIYSTWISQFYSVLLLICSVITYVQSDVPRPRGVSLSKAPLYSPTKDFTCFDGTITIPFSYVNDDYCDCFDGSDEPGTSACLNGFFHCTNAGHRPQNIPSSRVNDGVCDCCDGTDEYASEVTCSNTCEELGREARAEAQRLAELYKAGSHLRVELIEKGNAKRNEMAEQLQQLEKDKSEAEQIKNEKEALKNELESKENEALKVYREAEEQERQKKAEEEKQNNIKESLEYFTKLDSDKDEILTVGEISVSSVFDKNKDGQVDEEEVKYFFGDRESIDKDTFVSVTWPVLKPLLMMEQGMFKPAEEQEELEPEPDADEAADLDTEYTGQDDEASEGSDGAHEEVEEQEVESEQTNIYDEETQKLVAEASEARRHHTEAERTVREIEANIRKIQQNLEKDYGLQQEFATLDGECHEYEDKEYVYRLCIFQRVTQKSKNGGAEVGLGNWGEWAGGDHNKYSIMKYTNGVACWNGPSRITTVHVICGLETKLLSVTEPFRCEYKMEFSTPAACDESSPSSQHSSHDEL